MSLRRLLGLDLIDAAIHVGVTIAVAVAASTASTTGRGEEAIVAIVLGTSLVLFGWRRQRALRQQAAADVALSPGERAGLVEARLAELEALHERVLELENRVDFSERLLAQQGRADERVGEEA